MRILFVCMIESITSVRWVDQLRGTGWDVHVFPAIPGAKPHPGWRDVTLHGVGLWRPEGLDPSVRVAGLWPFRRGAYRASRVVARLGVRRDHAACLAGTIRSLNPDIVHSLEMQHGAYLTLAAFRRSGRPRPPWVYSCWGSDIYYFGQRPGHEASVRDVLLNCDYLITDCRRDTDLAQRFGFNGCSLGVFPGGGGYDVSAMVQHRQDPPSSRRAVAVKGYQSDRYGGRALVALQAVHRCADALREFRVVVYSAQTQSVADVVRHIGAVTGLRIEVLGHVPHADVLSLLGQSRVHLAVSETDGTPNSMLEAMIQGAFPIQSDTVSTGEWIEDGVNGSLVPPVDPLAIEVAIRRAVTDDGLVDRAAQENSEAMPEKAGRAFVRSRVLEAYGRVVAGRNENTGRSCLTVEAKAS